MNIVSSLVGISIMGAAAPSMIQMSLAPLEAQKRAENFSIAESTAVAFAANNEGQQNVGKAPDGCVLTNVAPSAYDITCTNGEGRFLQTVTRSFKLRTGSSYTNPTRAFSFETPKRYSHVECPVNDPWGVMWYNEHLKAGHLDACIPSPVWSRERYLASDPADWLYDLSDHGYGRHPLF